MANLFDKKYSSSLSDLLSENIPPHENHYSDALSRLLANPPPIGAAQDLLGGDTPLAGILNSLAPPTSYDSLSAAAAHLFGQPSPGIFGSLPPPAPTVKPSVKRRAFFSFHFDDVMRVNVVRNAWKITHPENALMRSFYDSSLWESRKLEGDEALKRLIREGVEYTSAVCVLVGSETWLRRWVKYEIARAIIDGRGLLAVHLNSINHHQTRTPHTRGPNPLDFMAVGKVQERGATRHYLFEKVAVPNGLGGYVWSWQRYANYAESVTLPAWVNDSPLGYVTPLSTNAALYDYIANEGHINIGAWIDSAALRAGR